MKWGGDLSALKTRVAELYKAHSEIMVAVAKKASGEFAPHQKAVAALLPRLQKAQKGEAVEFSEAEKAQLQAASAAGEKLLALAGIFPAAIAEQLKTMMGLARVAQINDVPEGCTDALIEQGKLLHLSSYQNSIFAARRRDLRQNLRAAQCYLWNEFSIELKDDLSLQGGAFFYEDTAAPRADLVIRRRRTPYTVVVRRELRPGEPPTLETKNCYGYTVVDNNCVFDAGRRRYIAQRTVTRFIASVVAADSTCPAPVVNYQNIYAGDLPPDGIPQRLATATGNSTELPMGAKAREEFTIAKMEKLFSFGTVLDNVYTLELIW